jgi:predicted aspartyl protease
VNTRPPTRRAVTGFVAAAGGLGFTPLFAQSPPANLAPQANLALEVVPPPPDAVPPSEAVVPTVAEPDASVPTTSNRFEHVTAPVRINGEGPFVFLVDTGANRSCVSTALALRLGLPPGPPLTVHTSVGKRVRQSALVERLEIGTRSAKRVHAPLLPIALRVDGVLGVDWLKGQRLVLNFKEQRLEITAPRAEKSQTDRVIVPARRRMGQLTIVDADMGETRLSAMIDSGSQVSMGNDALRRRLGAQPDRKPPQKIGLVSVTGERFDGDLLYLPFMRLGGLHLGNVPIVFSEMHVFQLWELTKIPTVVLGMDLLTLFNEVAVDYGRATVRFDFTGDQGLLRPPSKL